MSKHRFGEPYFATRDQLSHLMLRIRSLAKETSTSLPDPLPLTGESDDVPFHFTACGEINAGKSSFLNGLAGTTLCPTSDLPQTSEPIRLHQFDDQPSDLDTSSGIRICRRPLPLLRDVQLLDTPGLSSDNPQLVATLSTLLETTDLAFFILPVSNPWAPATWNFLSQLPQSTLEKTVLVIQQADQREAQDLEVLQHHVADLASKRLPLIPPIFAVSANRALQDPDSAASGYPALRRFITGFIQTLPARRARLQAWQDAAGGALATIDERLESQNRKLRDQNRFMDVVVQEIDSIRDGFIRRLPVHLVNVADTFEKEASWVTKRLGSRLGAVRSIARLFIGDRSAATIEAAFIERIRQAVESVAETDSREVADACKNHWTELSERIEESMSVPLTTSRPIDDTLQASREWFVQRLSRAAEQGINNLKVRHLLEKDLRHRNTALKSFTATTLLLTTIGATCGALDIPWAPLILLSLAALFLIGGFLTAWITRRAIIREFRQRLRDTCGAFASTLHHDYEHALQLVFKDYSETLSEVRDHLGREKLSIEPRQRAWQELFLTLKTIEQEMVS